MKNGSKTINNASCVTCKNVEDENGERVQERPEDHPQATFSVGGRPQDWSRECIWQIMPKSTVQERCKLHSSPDTDMFDIFEYRLQNAAETNKADESSSHFVQRMETDACR